VQEKTTLKKLRVSALIGAEPLAIILSLPPKAYLNFFKA
jgi:hypothetical protein